MSKAIAIVGSRRRATECDKDLLVDAFLAIREPSDRIVSGGCWLGADRFAEEIADEFGHVMTIYHADWDKYGKAAGPIRNTNIAGDCVVMLALPSRDRTGGTEDVMRKAMKLGVRVILL